MKYRLDERTKSRNEQFKNKNKIEYVQWMDHNVDDDCYKNMVVYVYVDDGFS